MRPFPTFKLSCVYDEPRGAYLTRLGLNGLRPKFISLLFTDAKSPRHIHGGPSAVAKAHVAAFLNSPEFRPTLEKLLVEAVTDAITSEVYRPDWE